MENKNSKTANTSGNFFGLLLLLFIGFKLAGVGQVADWPWWLVLAPGWAPLVGVLLVVGVLFSLSGIAWLIGQFIDWKWARRVRKAREKARKAEETAVSAAMAAERKLRSGGYYENMR